MGGVALRNPPALQALISCAGDDLNLEAGIKLNNATALLIACYMGDDETRVLLGAGCSVQRVNDHGGNSLTACCSISPRGPSHASDDRDAGARARRP